MTNLTIQYMNDAQYWHQLYTNSQKAIETIEKITKRSDFSKERIEVVLDKQKQAEFEINNNHLQELRKDW